MMLRITVDIEETTGDNSETSTIRKFIKIPDDASADVILETIPVALKHAAQQIVERIKEGIDE